MAWSQANNNKNVKQDGKKKIIIKPETPYKIQIQ